MAAPVAPSSGYSHNTIQQVPKPIIVPAMVEILDKPGKPLAAKYLVKTFILVRQIAPGSNNTNTPIVGLYRSPKTTGMITGARIHATTH